MSKLYHYNAKPLKLLRTSIQQQKTTDLPLYYKHEIEYNILMLFV